MLRVWFVSRLGFWIGLRIRIGDWFRLLLRIGLGGGLWHTLDGSRALGCQRAWFDFVRCVEWALHLAWGWSQRQIPRWAWVPNCNQFLNWAEDWSWAWKQAQDLAWGQVLEEEQQISRNISTDETVNWRCKMFLIM